MNNQPTTGVVPRWTALLVSGTLTSILLLTVFLTLAHSAPTTSATGPLAFGDPLNVCTAHYYAYGLALGDLDGDGDLDVVASADGGALGDYELFACENVGDNWIAHDIGAVNTHANSVVLGDLDNDGDLDVALGSGSGAVNGMEVSIWRNDGTPFDGPWSSWGVGYSPSNVYDIGLGDLDHDGDPDLVSGAEGDGAASEVVIWCNPLEDGVADPFTTVWGSRPLTTADLTVRTVAVSDLDRDGDPDVVVGRAGGGGDVVAWQNPLAPGSDPFLQDWPATLAFTSTGGVAALAAADLDRDGDDDILVGAGLLLALVNDGDPFGGPWSSVALDTTGDHHSVAAGDLDHDGDLDVVTGGGTPAGEELSAWLNDGSPFDGEWAGLGIADWGTGVRIRRVVLGDTDNDGDLDVLAGGHVPGGEPNVRLSPNLAVPHAQPVIWAEHSAQGSSVGEAAGDSAGEAAAIVGDVNADGYDDFVVGAPDADTIYLVLGKSSWTTGTNLADLASASFIGEAGDLAGDALAGVGDVNADGYDDFIIGADENDAGGGNSGQTYLILGRPTVSWTMGVSLTTEADASFIGESAGDRSGEAVAGVGDVNADGYDDFVIGASQNGAGGDIAGQTYLILGRPTVSWTRGMSLTTEADASFIGEAEGDVSGHAVTGVGDANRDGRDDFLISAPRRSTGITHTGEVYLLLGRPTVSWTMRMSLTTGADASFIGEAPYDFAGWSVAGAGDVNRDGYGDLLIGSLSSAAEAVGRTHLILGCPTVSWTMRVSLTTGADASFVGEVPYGYAGQVVAGAGDANADGYDDFLIGAPYAFTHTGRVYLVHGRPTAGWTTGMSLTTTSASLFDGAHDFDEFGSGLAGGGDVNADGYDDFLSGAPGNDDGGSNAGQVYLMLSAIDRIVPSFRAASSNVGQSDEAVCNLAAADLDNDGDDDLVAAQHAGGLSAWENDGTPFSGLWASSTVTTAAAYEVVVADLDLDGDLDAVTADPGVWLWENPLAAPHARTPFTTTWQGIPLTPTGSYCEPVIADLDNDGRPDVVAGTSSGLTVAPNVIRIWRNADATPFSGGWTSSTVTTTVATYSGILEVAVVDLDRDGWRDIVSAHYYGPAEGGVYVWHNDHTPFTGTWNGTRIVDDLGAIDLALGDFNVDGWTDVALQGDDEYAGHVRILLNDGTPFDGSWRAEVVGGMGMGGAELVTLDVDHDGDLDIASNPFWFSGDSRLIVWQNPRGRDPIWGYYQHILGSSSSQAGMIALATSDLDHNGDVDLITGHPSDAPYEIVAWCLLWPRAYLPLTVRNFSTCAIKTWPYKL